jgi:hypothetical protein
MAVDIDMDFQALQVDISTYFLKSKKLNGRTITLALYDLIKKRCSFEKLITLLSQNSMDSSVDMLFTQQFFLSYLLNNSDTYLRTMILIACSFFMPLPLVSYQPSKYRKIPMQVNYHGSKSGGGIMQHSSMSSIERDIEKETADEMIQTNFLPTVYKELFYCFENHMAVLAFKVSANPNKSPQGCTSLTNYVFNRTFQTHSKSLVNYGSIDI